LKLSPASKFKQNYTSGPLVMPQFGGQPVKEVETPIGGGHIPSEVFSVASNPEELQQIVQSLAKSEQTRFLDNLSDSHISGIMQAVTYS
jgi:hypothetical protein